MADLQKLLSQFNPTKETGKLLLILNVAGMVFAALSNTFAIVKDKDTKPENKKTLVPAGLATGVANIATYYAITAKLIKGLEKTAQKTIDSKKEEELLKNVKDFAFNKIEKAQKGSFFGLFGKKPEKDIKDTIDCFFKTESGKASDLLKNGQDIKESLKNASVTDYAKDTFKSDVKSGAGVLGAFIGAVIGCSIITPIIRDVSAYIVQKKMEKNTPQLKDKPYHPYFDPIHINSARYGKNGKMAKQPLSMTSYMSFTNGNLKV